MRQLITLEYRKLKRTFLTILLPLVSLAPFILILLSYTWDHSVSFASVAAKNIVFVQMISFALVVITGCYIVSREYRDQTVHYLQITTKSIIQVLFSKYVILFIQIVILQLFTFGILTLINGMIDGFDKQVTLKFLSAGLLSSLLLFCLTSVVIYIALLRRHFISSALLFLIIFMLTFPFAFESYGYFFPHLLPLILVAKLLGNGQYMDISYGMGILILVVIFIVFLYLSVQKIRTKE